MSGHQSLSVALGARSYEILVGEGLLAGAGRYINFGIPARQGRRALLDS